MNFVITGGCGFIGTSLVKYLLDIGGKETNIRIIDNLSTGKPEDLKRVCNFRSIKYDDLTPLSGISNSSVELIEGDILDEDLALKVVEGSDVIVHLAGNTGVIPSVDNPRKDCVSNVIGTFNYLEAARLNKVSRFVFASSGGTVIGDCEPPIHEELVPHPKSPYGASKSAAEGYCHAYYGTFGVDTVALRFSNVYGPGSNHKNSVIAKFLRRALKDKDLEIYGDGLQTRDFIFIDDLVKAVYHAATVSNIGGEVFQVATNLETSINEISIIVKNVLISLGVKNINMLNSSPLAGEVRRNFADISKAKKLLQWEPKVSLDEGIRKTACWFLEEHKSCG